MTDLPTSPSDGSPFESIRRTRLDGSEYWSARDLMVAVQYDRWENFASAIDRAKAVAVNQGHDLAAVFRDTTKNPDSSGGRPAVDVELTRFSSYLVVMNGDLRKAEIAAAQAYFAIRTREAETALPVLTGASLIAAAVIEAQAMLAAQSEALAVMAPKAEYVDWYVADGDLLKFRTVAANLKIKESELREILLERGWIYVETMTRWSESKQCKETVRRYSASSEKKAYFTPRPNHEAPRFKGEAMHTLKVTPTGAHAIERLINRSSIQPELALDPAYPLPLTPPQGSPSRWADLSHPESGDPR